MKIIKPNLLILAFHSSIVFAGLYTVKGIDADGNSVVGEVVTQEDNRKDGDGYIYKNNPKNDIHFSAIFINNNDLEAYGDNGNLFLLSIVPTSATDHDMTKVACNVIG